MNRDSGHFRIEDGAGRILRNNIPAQSPADAAENHFRTMLNQRDIVVVQTQGMPGGKGYYAAYRRIGTELEAVKNSQSVLVNRC